MTTPIDRESVEHEVMWLQTIREHEAADTLLALRAALDAAEADKQLAVAAALREAVEAVRRQHSDPENENGIALAEAAILALITGGKADG